MFRNLIPPVFVFPLFRPQTQDGRRSDREDCERCQRHFDESLQPANEDAGRREQDEQGYRGPEQEVCVLGK